MLFLMMMSPVVHRFELAMQLKDLRAGYELAKKTEVLVFKLSSTCSHIRI